MAKIGSFGDLIFSVSENTVKTFDKISWKTSAKYATHDRHIKADVQEFLGPEPGSISFTMAFSVFHGNNPLSEVMKLNEMVNNGIVERLVIGGRVYGSYKWVISSVASEMKRYDNKGGCWAATAQVTIACEGRITVSSSEFVEARKAREAKHAEYERIVEENAIKRKLQQQRAEEKYYQSREIASAACEANVLVEPVESSGFDSAATGTIV